MNIEEKIEKVTKRDNDVHHIFKKLLNNQSVFLSHEEIIDLIYLKREYSDNVSVSGRNKSDIISPAKMLIATNYGILIIEEGFKEISSDYYGYKIKDVYYNNISSIELDIALLIGEFKINTINNQDALIKFKTAEYYAEFEKFIEMVREKLIERCMT